MSILDCCWPLWQKCELWDPVDWIVSAIFGLFVDPSFAQNTSSAFKKSACVLTVLIQIIKNHQVFGSNHLKPYIPWDFGRDEVQRHGLNDTKRETKDVVVDQRGNGQQF